MILKKFRMCKRECLEVSYKEVKCILKKNSNTVLLDVRSPQEFREGHLNGAVNIPFYELKTNLRKLESRDNIIIVYCTSGHRSKSAVRELKKYGYRNVYNLKGGLEYI